AAQNAGDQTVATKLLRPRVTSSSKRDRQNRVSYLAEMPCGELRDW
ncbi:MAG: hypothetical protein ACI9NC_003611, partial [Verrucomicrobiales bacterium]